MVHFHCTITIIAIGFFYFVANAYAIGRLGKGEVILNSGAGAEYTSNVQLNSNEQSDLIGSLSAGIAYQQLERSVANFTASAEVEVLRYLDLKEADAENFFLDAGFSYPNNLESNTYYELGANWSRVTAPVFEVGQIQETEQMGVSGSYRLSLKERLEALLAGGFNRNSIGNDEPFNSTNLSFDLNYFYPYSSKLNIVTGYGYSVVENQGASGGNNSIQTNSHAFRVGLDGKLRPKLQGNVSLGVQFLDSSGVGAQADGPQLDYAMNLNWQANSKTSVSLSGSTSLQSTLNGGINNTRDLALGLNRRLSNKASGSIGVTYAQNEFSNTIAGNESTAARNEDVITFNSRYLYNLTGNKSLSLSADYEIRESDDDFFSYDRFSLVLDFQASF